MSMTPTMNTGRMDVVQWLNTLRQTSDLGSTTLIFPVSNLQEVCFRVL